MRNRSMRAWIGAAVVFLLVAGCRSLPPNTSPEGAIAIRGRQVIITADGVLTGVDDLVTAGMLKPADAIKVVDVIKRIGQEGQRLAKALAIVDQARDRAEAASGIQAAIASLNAIQRMVTEAVIPISDEGARVEVSKLLQNITSLVLGIAQALPATS